jgi:hypothetical protein
MTPVQKARLEPIPKKASKKKNENTKDGAQSEDAAGPIFEPTIRAGAPTSGPPSTGKQMIQDTMKVIMLNRKRAEAGKAKLPRRSHSASHGELQS